MKGNFHGIGVQFRMLQDTVAVSRVLKGVPVKKQFGCQETEY